MSKYEYVTPKYEAQLADLAHTLVTPERFGANADLHTEEAELVHMTSAEFVKFMGKVITEEETQCTE